MLKLAAIGPYQLRRENVGGEPHWVAHLDGAPPPAAREKRTGVAAHVFAGWKALFVWVTA